MSGSSPPESESDADRNAGTAQSGDAQSLAGLSASLYRFCLVVTVAVAIAKVVNRFDIGLLLDDAYMFQRYAHNLLAGHGIAWNPGGDAVYGLTAPLFLVPAVVGNGLAGGNPSLVARLKASTWR